MSQNNQQPTSSNDREPLQRKRDISPEPTSKRLKIESVQTQSELTLDWKAGPAVPDGEYMSRGATAVHGATAYFNSAGSSMVYKYCSKTNKWLNKITCPRTDFGLEVVKGFLTLIGGKVNKARIFTEVTNTLLSLPLEVKGNVDWSVRFPSMHTKRMDPETACIGQYVAVVGGKEGMISTHLNSVEVMDIETLQWHVCDSIPNISDISWMTMAASDDTLYVSGRACNRYFLCTCSMEALLQSSDAKGAIKPYSWQELQRPHVLTTPCTYTLTALNGQLMAAGCEHMRAVTVREDDEAQEEYECIGDSAREMEEEYNCNNNYFPPVHCYVYIYISDSWIKLSDSVVEMKPYSPLFVAVSGNKLILVGASTYNPHVRYTNVAMN